MAATSSRRVFFYSLGCAKNRVDTELMLGAATEAGCEVVADPAIAEAIVINTCGFIGDAKQESVDAVLEMARFKTEGACRRLIVTGCLTQRYPSEIAKAMPEIDDLFGAGEVARVAAAIVGEVDPAAGGPRIEVAAEPSYLQDATAPRVVTGAQHSVYVKIAEGCDRPCAFCIIPRLRGRQRSRPIADVATEVERLVDAGAREINLVAQDLTAYGQDATGDERPDLAKLVARLARVPGLRWLRLHYAYPTEITDQLIDVIAAEPVVVKYLDVPLQHIDDEVLRRMRRGHGERQARELVAKLRARVPGLVLRTTMLVGHPGETEDAYARLRTFVTEVGFDHLGVFPFSREEGTVSAMLPGRVPAATAKRRRNELMRLQAELSRRRLETMVGRELEVLVDGISDESEYLLAGRWYGQAPEVDGCVYLADGSARPGELVKARVTAAADYDLAATLAVHGEPA